MEVKREHLVRALLAGACGVDGLLGRDVRHLTEDQIQWADDAGIITPEERVAIWGSGEYATLPLRWARGSCSGDGGGSGYGDGGGGYVYGYGDGGYGYGGYGHGGYGYRHCR